MNTGLTYLAYLALLHWLTYRWAYSLTYVGGILLSFVLNSRFVFRVPLRRRNLLLYPVVYLVQYILGYAVLYAAVDLAGIAPWLGPAFVLAVTVPVSFLLSRWVLREKGTKGRENEKAAEGA